MNSMLGCRIIFRKDFNFPKFHYFFFLAQMILMIIQSTWTWIRLFLRRILTYRTFLNHPPYSINWLQGTKKDERPTEMFHPVPECIQRLAREEGKVNWDNFYLIYSVDTFDKFWIAWSMAILWVVIWQVSKKRCKIT